MAASIDREKSTSLAIDPQLFIRSKYYRVTVFRAHTQTKVFPFGVKYLSIATAPPSDKSIACYSLLAKMPSSPFHWISILSVFYQHSIKTSTIVSAYCLVCRKHFGRIEKGSWQR
jgi:hypothetical protein